MEMAKRLVDLWAPESVDDRQDQDPYRRIDELLEKLRQKQERLERKLARESRDSARRHLKLALAVVRLQRKKGLARRLELAGTAG